MRNNIVDTNGGCRQSTPPMARICIILLTFLLAGICQGRNLRPLVLVIDAGHGGKDKGTSFNGNPEKDINLDIAVMVKELLAKHKPGIKVIMTRSDDRFVSLDNRCKKANKANADLFLSIHVNSAPSRLMSGTETFYANLGQTHNTVRSGSLSRTIDRSELLARLLQKNYMESERPSMRGARKKNLYVCQNTNMPAVLTEIGFLSNIEDAAYMTSKDGKKEIAVNIFNALMEYYTTTQARTQAQSLMKLRNSGNMKSGINAYHLNVPGVYKRMRKGETVNEDAVEPKTDRTPKDEIPVAATGKEVNSVVETVKDTAQNNGAPTTSVPVYSIQIVAVRKETSCEDSRLKGLSPVTFVKDGNMYKGLYGGTTDYKQAQKTKESIKHKFPDAFIVAHIGGKPISVTEARKMTP